MLSLVPPDHPALRAVAADVRDFGQARVLATAMAALLKNRRGLGLAAPQVGRSLRLVVFANAAAPLPFALANPEIVERSEDVVASDEGCLSIPGVRRVVSRSRSVVVVGSMLGGADVRLSLSGLPARIAQHEIDHLRGVLITDLPALR